MYLYRVEGTLTVQPKTGSNVERETHLVQDSVIANSLEDALNKFRDHHINTFAVASPDKYDAHIVEVTMVERKEPVIL